MIFFSASPTSTSHRATGVHRLSGVPEDSAGAASQSLNWISFRASFAVCFLKGFPKEMSSGIWTIILNNKYAVKILQTCLLRLLRR